MFVIVYPPKYLEGVKNSNVCKWLPMMHLSDVFEKNNRGAMTNEAVNSPKGPGSDLLLSQCSFSEES
jgi:hypothetical protein